MKFAIDIQAPQAPQRSHHLNFRSFLSSLRTSLLRWLKKLRFNVQSWIWKQQVRKHSPHLVPPSGQHFHLTTTLATSQCKLQARFTWIFTNKLHVPQRQGKAGLFVQQESFGEHAALVKLSSFYVGYWSQIFINFPVDVDGDDGS